MTIIAILSAKYYATPGTGLHTITWSLSDAYSAIAAGTGAFAAFGTVYVLPTPGFCASGVQAVSIAAGVQASVYGAAITAGGLFATLQSWARREHWLARLELRHRLLG